MFFVVYKYRDRAIPLLTDADQEPSPMHRSLMTFKTRDDADKSAIKYSQPFFFTHYMIVDLYMTNQN